MSKTDSTAVSPPSSPAASLAVSPGLSASPAAPYGPRWVALAALLVAEAMNLLDSTIVQVAAPVIRSRLGGADADIQWLGAAYTLPFALLLITGGRLGDMFGRRRVWRVGVVGFLVASVGCAVAPSMGVLIVARVVAGGACALAIPQTFGLIKGMFAGDELSRALAWIGPVMGLAAVCGPVLGGVLTQADLFGSSWRAVFLVNVPLGLGVLVAGPLLREDRAPVRPRLDVVGTVLAVVGAALVIYPLIDGNTAGWPAWTGVMMGAGVVVFVVFGVHQRRNDRLGRATLVEPSLLRDGRFRAALVSSVLFFAVMTGLMLVVVLQMQLGRHADAQTAGLTVLPWSCGSAVASLVAGRWLVPRFGAKVMFAGLGVLLAGVLGSVGVYGHAVAGGGYPWLLLPALLVTGVGMGLFTVPFFTAALHRVRPQETGSAAGLLNAVQQVGGTVGTALLGTVFLHALAPGALRAAQDALWVAAGLVVVTVVSTVLMTRGPEAAG